MHILEKISFKYKLFIPVLFTIGILGAFLWQNYKLSSFMEKQLLAIYQQKISIDTNAQFITGTIDELTSIFIQKSLQREVNQKLLNQSDKKVKNIEKLIFQIKNNEFLDEKKILNDLDNLGKRLDGYYAILKDLSQEYEESEEDAIYAITSLISVKSKIQQELNTVMSHAKKHLSEKLTTMKNMTAENRFNSTMLAVISIFILTLFSFLIIFEMLNSIKVLQNVNKSFSDFLHKRIEKIEKIKHFPKDEIGQILHLIDDNVTQAEILISKERMLSDEIHNLNSTLEQRVKSALVEVTTLNKEIEDTQREVIFTMGAIGESRSKETGNHVRRVAEYSKLLATLYGIDEEEANLIKESSPMHDIGKVGIPDSILNKPARLTEEEFQVMKTHAQIGYDMLKHSKRPILQAAAIVAHQHHEKYNGTGYPNGLKGDEIHIYGSITAIADVFDALGSDRVYKKAWPLDKILNFFKEEKGEHFHPQLTQLLLDNIEAFLKIRERYADKEFVETCI